MDRRLVIAILLVLDVTRGEAKCGLPELSLNESLQIAENPSLFLHEHLDRDREAMRRITSLAASTRIDGAVVRSLVRSARSNQREVLAGWIATVAKRCLKSDSEQFERINAAMGAAGDPQMRSAFKDALASDGARDDTDVPRDKVIEQRLPGVRVGIQQGVPDPLEEIPLPEKKFCLGEALVDADGRAEQHQGLADQCGEP